MVNIVFPAPPQKPREPKPSGRTSRNERAFYYVVLMLAAILTLAGLWYAQVAGYLSFLPIK